MPEPTIMQVPAYDVRTDDMLLVTDDGTVSEHGQPRLWERDPQIGSKWATFWTEDRFGDKDKFIWKYDLAELVWIVRAVKTDLDRRNDRRDWVRRLRERAALESQRQHARYSSDAESMGLTRAMERHYEDLVAQEVLDGLWQEYDRYMVPPAPEPTRGYRRAPQRPHGPHDELTALAAVVEIAENRLHQYGSMSRDTLRMLRELAEVNTLRKFLSANKGF